MDKETERLKLLLVDDEADFRHAMSSTLTRRGFIVSEAASGAEALEMVKKDRPDIVVLDLKMPGMGGIETLQHMRELHANLPVIILTGHGDFESAMAGIRLEVIDFVQKPVDPDQLAVRIRRLLERTAEGPLRERTIEELMVSTARYPRLYDDQPVVTALDILRKSLLAPEREAPGLERVRSALVYDRSEKFQGILRFADLLKIVVPPFLGESPYASFFTGMFLAQCKVIANRKIFELIADQVTIDAGAPLMQAVHLMIKHHIPNLPVMCEGKLAGILREREIIAEISRTREI